MNRAPISTFVNGNGLSIGNLMCQNHTDTLLPIDWDEYEGSDAAYVQDVHSVELTDEDALILYRDLVRHLTRKGLLPKVEETPSD